MGEVQQRGLEKKGERGELLWRFEAERPKKEKQCFEECVVWCASHQCPLVSCRVPSVLVSGVGWVE